MIPLVHRLLSVLVVATLAASTSSAWAKPVDPSEIKSRQEQIPERLEGVDVEENLEGKVPRALSFVDERGQDVLYDQVVKGELPTILTMNYSDCPMLCSLQLNALVNGLKQIDLTLGKDYRVVTVALDPNETPEQARKTRNKYLAQYGRPDAPQEGWKFLTGSEANIRAVAEALGISYNYNEKRDEYLHPAVFLVSTPKGVIARYMYGLDYHPKTLRLSLVEASEGKIGSSVDRLILYCFHYDASEGKYAPVAMNIMRVAGSGFALALALLLVVLWRNERRKKLSQDSSGSSSGANTASSPLAESTR